MELLDKAKVRCHDCPLLTSDSQGDWICGAYNKPIEQVLNCPEWTDEQIGDITKMSEETYCKLSAENTKYTGG